MSGKEDSIIFIIKSVIGALNDIRYEMENFNPEEGFSVKALNHYVSNAEKGLEDVINSIEGGNTDV